MEVKAVFLLKGSVLMTALVDFPVTDTPDPRDPLTVAAMVRSFDLDELTVALHLSGAKLTRAMGQDLDLLVSLAQIGAASLGPAEFYAYVDRMAEARSAMVQEMQQGLSAEGTAAVFLPMLGGYRRSQMCVNFAYRLLGLFGPSPLARVPYACDPS